MDHDLAVVLNNAQNPNPAIRNAAESQLNDAAEKQYGPFLMALCTELATEGKADSNRQLAGLYLKNLITAQDPAIQEQKQKKWMECDPDLKTQIKAAFLHAILSPVPVVCHTAAQVTAAYGAIDLPRGEWPTLLSLLFHNVTADSVGLGSKVASLEALGYMCDAMTPDQIEKSVVDQILNAIVDGMRVDRPNEMKLAAITAMCNSLDFTEKNFDIQVERDHIMSAICSASQCSELRVRVKAFECLATVANFYYSTLPNYIDTLFKLTLTAIKSDEQVVGQQAIEFWSTVCDTESQLVADLKDGGLEEGAVYYRLMEQAAAGLIPDLLETLTKQDDSGNEDSWNIAMAGAACLDVIAQTIEDAVVDLVLPFVTANMSSNLWRQREAAIMAFGSTLDGPSAEKLAPIVVGALPHLINCIRDQHASVRDTATWTVGRICEYHVRAIPAELIAPMVTALSIVLDDPESKVSSQACYAFYNMAAACADASEANSNVLSSFMQQILHKLLLITNREDWDTNNLRTSAYEAVNMLITNSAADMLPVVFMMLGEALNRLEGSWNDTNCDPHEKMNLQSQLCSLIGTCVQKLPEAEFKSATSDRIVTLVLQVFQIKGAVAHEDAFMTLGYLAGKLGSDFSVYAKFIMPAVLAGLKNVEEHSVVTVAGGVVGDLCRAMGKGVLMYCDDIMRSLLELLQSQTVNREVKPHVISLFADIAMAIEGDFERYCSIVLMMLHQAGQVGITSDDDDLIDYVNSLREAILEAYTGIVQGLKSANKQEDIVPSLDNIIEFVHRSTVDENRTSAVVKAAVGVLGDLGDSFGAKMFPVFSQPYVLQLLSVALQDEESKEVAAWAQKIILNIRAKKGPV